MPSNFLEPEFSPPQRLARILAEDRPFGDSTYIHAQLQATCCRRLTKISHLLPAAGDLVDQLAGAEGDIRYRVLGDPVLRYVTQQLLTQSITGATRSTLPLSDCAEVINQTVQRLKRGEVAGPLETGDSADLRLGPGRFHGWIWSEDRPEDVCTRTFRHLVKANLGGPLSSPNPGDIEALRYAATLLERVSPPLALSALSHAHVIALFPESPEWKRVSSCSQFRVGGVIFLSRSSLGDPWYVAEHMIHEALHQKLYDMRHTHSILLRDFRAEITAADESPSVVSLWNAEGAGGSNRWGVSRSLAALHVYVHLAVYAQLAEQAAATDRLPGCGANDEGLVNAASAFRRALYLRDQIYENYGDEFGLAGKCLLEWLSQCLELISAMPTQSELRAALFLERYEREVRNIEAFIAQGRERDLGLLHGEALSELVATEISSTRRVLSMHEGPELLEEFDRQLIECLPRDAPLMSWPDFARLRRLIHRALTSVLIRDRSLKEAPLGDEIVEAMVENSSKQLVRIMSNVAGGGSRDRALGSTSIRGPGRSV